MTIYINICKTLVAIIMILSIAVLFNFNVFMDNCLQQTGFKLKKTKYMYKL